MHAQSLFFFSSFIIHSFCCVSLSTMTTSKLICLSCLESCIERDLDRINGALQRHPLLDDSFLGVFWKNYTEIKACEIERQFLKFQMDFVIAEVIDELICFNEEEKICVQEKYMKLRFFKGIQTIIMMERILGFGVILLGIRERNKNSNILE